MTPTWIGVDLGGTMIRAGLVSETGNVLDIVEMPVIYGPQAPIGSVQLEIAIRELLAKRPESQLVGIGIGASGPVNRQLGVIENPYTLPGWENIPIAAPLEKCFQVSVTMENDADAAALGEYWSGAGKGSSRLYAITVGTGIGTAFIQQGRVYRGLDGTHPDGGHAVVDPSGPLCYCGSHGCWESLASGPAIAEYTRQVITPASEIWRLAGENAQNITAALVAQAAVHKDPLALQIIQRTARYLAEGIVSINHLFVPEVIVLSGGVMKSYELFLPAILTRVRQSNIMVPSDKIKIIPAALGYYAGIVGAAYAAYQVTHGEKDE